MTPGYHQPQLATGGDGIHTGFGSMRMPKHRVASRRHVRDDAQAPEANAAPSRSPLGGFCEEIEESADDGIRCLLGLMVAGVDGVVP
jgi:hypothetical protein